MPLLLYKPKGKKILPQHLKKCVDKNTYTFAYFKRGEEWQKESGLSNKLQYQPEDDDELVMAFQAFATFGTPIVKDDFLFFHLGVYDRINDGDRVLKEIKDSISKDGFIKTCKHFTGKCDKTITILGDEVSFNKENGWQEEEGVVYSNTDYKESPINNHNSAPPSTPVNTNSTPSSRVQLALDYTQEDALVLNHLVIKKAGNGMRRFFNTEAQVYIERSYTYKVKEIDFIENWNGIHNPSFDFVKASFPGNLANQLVKVKMTFLRYIELSPKKITYVTIEIPDLKRI